MKIASMFVLAAFLFLAAESAQAHTALCNCYDNGDGTITCEGGFSDGSSAAGVTIRVKSDGKVVQQGAMDELSTFSFKKPESSYVVEFDAGEGHLVSIPGDQIFE